MRSYLKKMVIFDPKTSSFSLDINGFRLDNCSSEAALDDKSPLPLKWKSAGESGDKLELEASNSAGKWRLVLQKAKNANGVDGLTVRMSATLAKKHEKISLRPLSTSAVSPDHLLSHGRKMGGCHAFEFPAKEKSEFKSWFVCSVTKKGLTLSVTTPLNQKTESYTAGRVSGRKIDALRLETHIDPCLGKSVASETFSLFASPDGHALTEAWADANIEVVKKPAECPPGWNTWDYYRWTITEEEVLKNAEFIARDPVLSKHVKRIIIDDGWQYCYGEWEANPLFPGGMEKLARELKKMGFAPGLWFAPTIIEPHARIAQIQPEILAKGRAGLPCLSFSCMERFGFVLDPTQEKVRKWIKDLFARYTKMGYEYFKLDFLASTLSAPCFEDKTVPRGRVITNVVESVRSACGNKAKILGCNYPFDAGNKFVDYVRVSGDIHAFWSSVQENVHSIAGRYWSHGRLWVNDPDFTLCRGDETSNDPDLHKLKACLVYVKPEDRNPPALADSSLVDVKYDEILILLSLVIISGGSMNLSDKMYGLNKKGLELARKAISAPNGESGVPLDLFKSARPALWAQKTPKGHRVLLINWGDKPSKMELDLRDCRHKITQKKAANFWTGEKLDIRNGRISASLKPRSCLLADLF